MSDFINPYNFIPFGDGPDRSDVHEYYSDKTKLISGWIDVLVTPKTSLIITDGKPLDKDGNPIPLNNNDKEHCYFKFFRTQDGKYAIPGSSLRGVTRSVYEAASNSCLPFLLDIDDELSIRVPNYASFKERGLIAHVDGRWILYSAQVDKCEVNNYRADIIDGKWNGHENAVYVKDGMYEGWLQLNMPVAIPNGHKYHVAFLKPDIELQSYDDEFPYPYIAMKTALEYTVSEERKKVRKSKNNPADKTTEVQSAHALLLKQLELAKNDPSVMVPVWYLKVEDQYYFSPSSIGRVYQNGWEKILGKYAPCSQLDALCPACKLFGTTADGGTKGHLRFTDAILVDPDKAHVESVDLPILSNPRPSAYEFYINRPKGATYWNYNYYSYKNGDNVAHVSVKDMMMPRGRKFYWHSSNEQIVAKEENSHLNASMEAMRAEDGVAFRSRIYFDMITEVQLSQLKWVLTFGCNKVSDNHLHKIGHARPMGYGSVKMSIENIGIRKVSFSESKLCYTIDTEAVDENSTFACPWGIGAYRIKALLKMSDFNAVGNLPVDYPRISEYEREIFKWFAENRKKSYIQVLPLPTDSDKGLYRDGKNAPNKDKSGNNGNQPNQEEGKKADDTNVVTAKVTRVGSSGTYFKLPDGSTGYMRGVRTLKIGADISVRVGEKNALGNYDVEYA